MATLSVIGTPIGNLEDITLRALRVMAAADLILCEDTRVTRKLLERHGLKKPTLSYHAHSKLSRVDEITAALRAGQNLVLVSDAGTPGISDPGTALVAWLRREMAAQIKDGTLKIEAVPGPSALSAALSIAGVSCADFLFLGFLPHKKGRETLFREIAATERTVVFYESPHRVIKTLEALAGHLDPGRQVTICRELTKVFEEVVTATAEELLAYFGAHSDKVRGEFVVIVHPKV